MLQEVAQPGELEMEPNLLLKNPTLYSALPQPLVLGFLPLPLSCTFKDRG